MLEEGATRVVESGKSQVGTYLYLGNLARYSRVVLARARASLPYLGTSGGAAAAERVKRQQQRPG